VTDVPVARCLFCGGERVAPHVCDGRQGRVEDAGDLTLDDVVQVVEDDDDNPRTGTIADRAERFHRRNPNVYRFAVRVARYMKSRGLRQYGIGAVWEVMRFKYLESFGDVYKLNNNYRAWYARRIMRLEPDLADFFRTRDCPHDAEYTTREVRT